MTAKKMSEKVAEKGFFISIEGIDGCGKSTQAAKLCQWLEDVRGPGSVLRTFEPGGWEGGPSLRRLLLGGTPLSFRTELLLFLADRSGHLDAEIAPALERGQWVVCERYTDSTLAYQSWGRGIAPEELEGLLSWARFPAPDLTVFLDIGPEAVKPRLERRGGLDRIESADTDFMARVTRGYRELAGRDPGRIVTVDADEDEERVAAAVRDAVEKRMGETR